MKDTTIAIIIICIIMIPVLFEVGLLTYAYINADRVECNFLWCSFITERTTQESRTFSDCYVNGEPINCSENELAGLKFFESKCGSETCIENMMKTVYKK